MRIENSRYRGRKSIVRDTGFGFRVVSSWFCDFELVI